MVDPLDGQGPAALGAWQMESPQNSPGSHGADGPHEVPAVPLLAHLLPRQDCPGEQYPDRLKMTHASPGRVGGMHVPSAQSSVGPQKYVVKGRPQLRPTVPMRTQSSVGQRQTSPSAQISEPHGAPSPTGAPQ
jgi:hypothetical protein